MTFFSFLRRVIWQFWDESDTLSAAQSISPSVSQSNGLAGCVIRYSFVPAAKADNQNADDRQQSTPNGRRCPASWFLIPHPIRPQIQIQTQMRIRILIQIQLSTRWWLPIVFARAIKRTSIRIGYLVWAEWNLYGESAPERFEQRKEVLRVLWVLWVLRFASLVPLCSYDRRPPSPFGFLSPQILPNRTHTPRPRGNVRSLKWANCAELRTSHLPRSWGIWQLSHRKYSKLRGLSKTRTGK